MASKIDVKAWDCMNNLPIPADKEAEASVKCFQFPHGVTSLIRKEKPTTSIIERNQCPQIFEEIATRQILFEGTFHRNRIIYFEDRCSAIYLHLIMPDSSHVPGIDTVPPRKDMDHLVFFCEGVR